MTVPALAVLGRGVVDPTTPALRADDLVVLRGSGVFETVRVAAGRPVLLREHLARMRGGAAALGVRAPAEAEWADLAATVVAASGAGDGVLKLVATPGPEGAPDAGTAFSLVTPVPDRVVAAREQGVRAVTLGLGIDPGAAARAPWLLRGVKSTSYAVAMAGLRAAEDAEVGEAVWLANDGTVLEAPTSNVVWVRGGRAYTTPLELGVLAGVTLAALRERYEVADRAAHVDELRSADEVMLTSSIRGVAPVLSLDGAPVGDGTPGPVTRALRAAYEEICLSGR